MKKLIFIFVLTLGIISCNSDDVAQDEVQIDITDLIGKWNWISTCGGITGECGYPSEDNFHSIEFKDESTYIKISNGILSEQSSFSIIETSVVDSYNLYIIDFDKGNSTICRVQDDNLSMGSGTLLSYYERFIE